ncbi:hypothetical protein EDC01DRAFT_636646 [Geopyxis carbonaria]|nr:hypothetical protein EDC01DRAFT_636646 [Geopyxis carbonaria]
MRKHRPCLHVRGNVRRFNRTLTLCSLGLAPACQQRRLGTWTRVHHVTFTTTYDPDHLVTRAQLVGLVKVTVGDDPFTRPFQSQGLIKLLLLALVEGFLLGLAGTGHRKNQSQPCSVRLTVRFGSYSQILPINRSSIRKRFIDNKFLPNIQTVSLKLGRRQRTTSRELSPVFASTPVFGTACIRIHRSTKLGVHQGDLPDDHPKTEQEAFGQVGLLFKSQASDLDSVSSPQPARPHGSISSLRQSVEPFYPESPSGQEIPEIITMDTLFPEKFKSDHVLAFNGNPGKVLSLDITVEDMCYKHNYPAYYGGTVIGQPKTGYRYVTPGVAGSASNHQFGTRLCSSITAKFVENARMWWEDYRKHDGPKPNCWKRADLNPECAGSKPLSVTEVSLFDLLKEQFPEEKDEIEAALELKQYKSNPSDKDATPFATFKTYSQSLALRAGIEKWKQRMPHIIQCIEPLALRNAVRLYDEESKFWFECCVTVNTWLSQHPVSRVKCGNCNGAHDTKDTATNLVNDDKDHDDSCGDNMVSYFMNYWRPPIGNVASDGRSSGPNLNLGVTVCEDEGLDELLSTPFAGKIVDYTLYNNMTAPVETVDVIQNVIGKTAKPASGTVKVSDSMDMSALGPVNDECPTGPVWTVSSTLRGQDLLTIFDTGAVKAAIPVSTANGSQSAGWHPLLACWILS